MRGVRRICLDCGQPFVLTRAAIRFFADRDLRLPRRCGRCWAARREPPQTTVYVSGPPGAGETRGR